MYKQKRLLIKKCTQAYIKLENEAREQETQQGYPEILQMLRPNKFTHLEAFLHECKLIEKSENFSITRAARLDKDSGRELIELKLGSNRSLLFIFDHSKLGEDLKNQCTVHAVMKGSNGI